MQKATNILANELKLLNPSLKNAIASSNEWVNKIMYFIVKRKGKQLRPTLVLLCAKIAGQINDSTYRAANLVEILHTATLVHDDVVDNANQRRGFFALNALWGSKAAILTGDYLLAKGLLLALENKDFFILEILSDAVRAMSEGELMQLEKARRLDITQDIYYEIIKRKTASLFAASCAVGAYSTSKNQELSEAFKNFGLYAGIAFQIKDDILDYATNEIGKPTGNDIKERKLTLPLIHTLQHCTAKEKAFLINTIKNNNNNTNKVQEVHNLVNQYQGITQAETQMNNYISQAKNCIAHIAPSETKDALLDVLEFMILRKH
jgi:octaprenyl-diphosphate synthase